MEHMYVNFCKDTDGFNMRMRIEEVSNMSLGRSVHVVNNGNITILYDERSAFIPSTNTIENGSQFVVHTSDHRYRGKIILDTPTLITPLTMLIVSKIILTKFETLAPQEVTKYDVTIVERHKFGGIRGWKVNGLCTIAIDPTLSNLTYYVIDINSRCFTTGQVTCNLRVNPGRFIWFVNESGDFVDNPIASVTL